ncbi:MAG: amidase, partial [Bacteroidetes bacterium]
MARKYTVLVSAFFFLLFQYSCQQSQDSTKSDPVPFPFEEKDIAFLTEGFQNGDFSIEEVTQAFIDRIDEIDKNGHGLNSIIQVNPDAVSIARQLDEALKNGDILGPLHGIPVVLKDNIDTHDKMPTTAGSRAMANSFPLQDSYVAMKLREAGAVIIAKANLSEWANFRGEMSSSGWSGVGGQTRNPYVLD